MATDLRPARPSGAGRQPSAGKYESFVDEQLSRARRRIRLFDLAAAGLGFLILTLAYSLLMALADRWLQLAPLVRQITFAFYGLLALAYLGWFGVRPLLQPINPYYAAHKLEETLPEAKNSVINWLDLREDEIAPVFRQAIGHRAAKDLARADLDQAISARRTSWLGGGTFGLFLTLLVLYVMSPQQFLSLMNRAFAPFVEASIATRTRLELRKPESGDLTVPVGRAVSFEVWVEGRIPDPAKADALKLLYRYGPADPYQERAMDRGDSDRLFVSVIRPEEVQTGFWYKITGGDAETPEYRVQVRSTPLLTGFDVTYHYRPYLRWPDQTTHDQNLHGYKGTEVTLVAHTNRKVKEGQLEIDGRQQMPGELVAEDPQALRFQLMLEKDGKYRIRFTSVEGETNLDPMPYSIQVKADEPPRVVITKPGQDIGLPANGLLHVEGSASDDIGIASLILRLKMDQGLTLQPKPYRGGKVRLPDGGCPQILDYLDNLDLVSVKREDGKAYTFKPGEVLEYWLEATDNCDYPKPNLTASTHYKVTIKPPDADKKKQQQEKQKAEKQEQEHAVEQQKKLEAEQAKKENARNENQESQPQNQDNPQPSQAAQGNANQSRKDQGDQSQADQPNRAPDQASQPPPDQQSPQGQQPENGQAKAENNSENERSQPQKSGEQGMSGSEDEKTRQQSERLKQALDNQRQQEQAGQQQQYPQDQNNDRQPEQKNQGGKNQQKGRSQANGGQDGSSESTDATQPQDSNTDQNNRPGAKNSSGPKGKQNQPKRGDRDTGDEKQKQEGNNQEKQPADQNNAGNQANGQDSQQNGADNQPMPNKNAATSEHKGANPEHKGANAQNNPEKQDQTENKNGQGDAKEKRPGERKENSNQSNQPGARDKQDKEKNSGDKKNPASERGDQTGDRSATNPVKQKGGDKGKPEGKNDLANGTEQGKDGSQIPDQKKPSKDDAAGADRSRPKDQPAGKDGQNPNKDQAAGKNTGNENQNPKSDQAAGKNAGNGQDSKEKRTGQENAGLEKNEQAKEGNQQQRQQTGSGQKGKNEQGRPRDKEDNQPRTPKNNGQGGKDGQHAEKNGQGNTGQRGNEKAGAGDPNRQNADQKEGANPDAQARGKPDDRQGKQSSASENGAGQEGKQVPDRPDKKNNGTQGQSASGKQPQKKPGKQEAGAPDARDAAREQGTAEDGKKGTEKPADGQNDQGANKAQAGHKEGANDQKGSSADNKNESGKPTGGQENQAANKPKTGQKDVGEKGSSGDNKKEALSQADQERLKQLAKDLQSSDPKARQEAERKVREMLKNSKDPGQRQGGNADALRKAVEDLQARDGSQPKKSNEQSSDHGHAKGEEHGSGERKGQRPEKSDGGQTPDQSAGQTGDKPDQGSKPDGGEQKAKGDDTGGPKKSGKGQEPGDASSTEDNPNPQSGQGGARGATQPRKTPSPKAADQDRGPFRNDRTEPGTAPDQRFQKKASSLQLDDFKKINDKVIKDAGMTPEDYKRFEKAYRELLKRETETPPTGKDKLAQPERGNRRAANQGVRRIDRDPLSKSGTIDRQGTAGPPAKYRDAQKEFQKLLEDLQSPVPNR
jgi:hypothetical protein